MNSYLHQPPSPHLGGTYRATPLPAMRPAARYPQQFAPWTPAPFAPMVSPAAAEQRQPQPVAFFAEPAADLGRLRVGLEFDADVAVVLGVTAGVLLLALLAAS